MAYSQEKFSEDLILDDPEDINLLLEDFPTDSKNNGAKNTNTVSNSSLVDDLDILKSDLKDMEFDLPKEDDLTKQIDTISPAKTSKVKITNGSSKEVDKDILDIGAEEAKLLTLPFLVV